MLKYKMVVRGGYGLTNFGDDALLKSIHDNYLSEYNPKQIAYSCTQTPYLGNYLKESEILPLMVDYSKITDVLLYGGGTQFYSFNKNSIREKFINNRKLLLNPLALFNKAIKTFKRKTRKGPAASVKEKKIALGIGVGPFLPEADPRVEIAVRNLFTEMEFVAVRDVYSYEKCKEWGVKNFKMYADICFKMEYDKFFTPNSKTSIEKVGIIVRDWERTINGSLYVDNLINFSNELKSGGKEVIYLVFAKEKDLRWLDKLKMTNENMQVWDPDNGSMESFIDILSEFDLFITTRYHGAVFSAMLGKPFITVEIEPKLKMISDLFKGGSENWSGSFDIRELRNNFDKIESNYAFYAKEVLNQAFAQRASAQAMKKDLDFCLNTLQVK